MAKKDYQDFKLKINMKTILLYEEMSGKSFYEVGGEDIMLLIYCALVVNNDLSITKNHFDIIMKNEKIARELMTKCQSELDFIQQFIKTDDKVKQETEEVEKDNKVSNVVNMILLQNNLDMNYVMYEMRLWELAPLIKSIEEKTKAEMVEKRFWAYLNICPHIDSKKIKGPEDILPFPWEKDNKKEAALKFMDDNNDAIKAFFNKNKTEDGEG
jgi:DNA gyrase/topoisomerase IV subunit B